MAAMQNRQQQDIAVIVPTKNRSQLLAQAVGSVVAQTYANWELLVVDDGSDDDTEQMMNAAAAQDTRIRFLKRHHAIAGANVCRNIGAQKAMADLVVFLDSDDLLEPTALEARVAAMRRNLDADFVVFQTGVFRFEPGDLGRQLDPELVGDDLLKFLYMEPPWQTTAPTWRRTALRALGGFDEALSSWQDIDLHVRALASGLKYLRFSVVDHHMRWSEDPERISLQQRRSARHLESTPALLAKLEHVVRSGVGMTWRRQRALCSLYLFVAERWLEIGRTADAARVWRLAHDRGLAPTGLYLGGRVFLNLPRVTGVQRTFHKWKGAVQLRNNPELV